jgi:hypothetical protein
LGDHPHAPAVRSILALLDSVAADRDLLRADMAGQVAARHDAELRAARLSEDASRLADWIVRHPSEHDPSEVLSLHDRAAG